MNFNTKVEETKYLTEYYLQGANRSEEPKNWNNKLKDIQNKLGWTPENQTFAALASQVR